MISKIINSQPMQITLGALIIMGTLICVFTPSHFLFKWGASFAVYIMIGYLLLSMVFLFFQQTRLMFVSFACCAALCIFLKQSSNTDFTMPTKTDEDIIKVAHFNIAASDEDYSKTIQTIISTDADLISIQEVTPDWDEILKESLAEKYPYSSAIVRFDPFGIAIYSRYPFQEIDTLMCEDIPNLTGTIKAQGNGKTIRFISAHTTPPLFSSAYDKMKRQLKMIGEFADKVQSPMITLGDFHAPPWWGEIQDLKEIAQLQDSRRSATYGFSDVFKTPVDYILYSSELTCIDFKAVLSKTSNHLGIQGIYQFNSKDNEYYSKANR